MFDATRLFVLRHGQTAWNAEARIQGQLDIPLDETGRWQAERLAERDAEAQAEAQADEPLAAIYSSDLQRAWSTAQPLALRTGAPLIADPRLRERGFGSFEGRTYAEIESTQPEDARRWRQREPGFAPGGGERLLDFYPRCVDAVLALAARHPGQVIAVVAHGGVLDCLYRAATGVALEAPRSWPVANATVNRLLFNGHGLSLVVWGDAAHLDAPAEF